MTIQEAYARIRSIREIAHDDESAHADEDDFREEVLKFICKHGNDQLISELARIALSTGEIKFSRWCA